MRRSSALLPLLLAACQAPPTTDAPAQSRQPGPQSAQPPLEAPEPEPTIATAQIEAARKAVEGAMAEKKLPALSIAVCLEGELVWSQAFGMANRQLDSPATRTTLFRTGSLSKSLTSAALGLLVEEDRLDLDAPIQDYVPGFPIKSGVLTTRLLAGHLSGLPHYSGNDFVNTTHYESVTAALDKFKDRPLLFEPGSRQAYSSYGWNLIGAVLEGAGGMEFLDLMSARVIEPLNLDHTLPELGEHPDQAVPYARLAGVTMIGPKIDNSDAWPSAGFLSTAEDLVRFGDSMLSSSLLTPATIELLWTRQVTSTGQVTDYGMGWQWTELAGRPAVGHGGSHVGATAALWILPEEGLVVAVLTNTNARGLSLLVGSVIEAVLGPAGGVAGA